MSLNVPNLDKLISYLEALPPEEFNMGYVFKNDYGGSFCVPVNTCGTVACIAGHCGIISSAPARSEWSGIDAGDWLGLGDHERDNLFMPNGWEEAQHNNRVFPLARAIRTLKHLRSEFVRTGKVVVDWDAPEAAETPRKPWAPPLVIGADKALPSSLTSLLREPEDASSIVEEATR